MTLPFGSRVHTAVYELEALTEYKDLKFWEERILRYGLHNFVHPFTLQYRQRMWILPEIGLASNITLLFDTMSADWAGFEYLRNKLRWTKHLESYTSVWVRKETSTFGGLLLASQAFRLAFHRLDASSNTLEELIYTCQFSVCADLRDKVYAVLGLAKDCQNAELEIDYSKSLFEVYSDVMNFCRKTYCDTKQCERLLRLSRILQASFDRAAELNDGAEKFLSCSDVPTRNTMFKLRGLRTGIISQLRAPVHSGTLLDKVSRRPPHLGMSPDPLSKQLLELSKAYPITSKAAFATQVSFPFNLRSPPENDNTKQSKIYRPSKDKTIHTCLPLITDDNRTGYVPPNTQIGDTVCQFPDSEIIAVLRELQDGRYEILGRAFVEIESSSFRPVAGYFSREIGFEVDVVTLQQLTAATDPVLIMPVAR